MTATRDCSNGTAILLIQPASNLEYGRAAYPANLSFLFGRPAMGTYVPYDLIAGVVKVLGRNSPPLQTSVRNSCNLVTP